MVGSKFSSYKPRRAPTDPQEKSSQATTTSGAFFLSCFRRQYSYYSGAQRYTCCIEVDAATAQFRPLQRVRALAEVVDRAAVPGRGGVLHVTQVADPRSPLPAPAAEAVHVGFAALAPHGAMATVVAACVVTADAAVVRKVNDTWHRQLSLWAHTHK